MQSGRCAAVDSEYLEEVPHPEKEKDVLLYTTTMRYTCHRISDNDHKEREICENCCKSDYCLVCGAESC